MGRVLVGNHELSRGSTQPKYAWLQEQLRAQIQRLQPGDTLPTIAEIRQQYSVSQPTVDRAIQALRTEGLIECRRGSGIFVTPRAKEVRVGLVFGGALPDVISTRFYNLLLSQFQALSVRLQIPLRYYFADPDDHSAHGLNQVQADMAAREINSAVTINLTPAWPWWDVPTVTFDGYDALPGNVYLDGSNVIRTGIDVLAQRGCQSFALMCHDFSPLHEREIAIFVDHLAASRLRTRLEWIFSMDIGHTPMELWGYQEFQQRWHEWEEKPDALISVDDHATLGLLHGAAALGLDLQQQLQIASHANKGSQVLDGAPVVCIAFDPEEITTAMLRRVSALLRGEVVTDAIRIIPHLLDEAEAAVMEAPATVPSS